MLIICSPLDAARVSDDELVAFVASSFFVSVPQTAGKLNSLSGSRRLSFLVILFLC